MFLIPFLDLRKEMLVQNFLILVLFHRTFDYIQLTGSVGGYAAPYRNAGRVFHSLFDAFVVELFSASSSIRFFAMAGVILDFLEGR